MEQHSEELRAITNFVFEMGQLREERRSGWKLIRVAEKETVAEHSLRAAQIGYILALMEGYQNPEEVAAMLVFHDMSETRIGDIHKIARRYIIEEHGKEAVAEQTSPLHDMGESIRRLWMRVEERSDTAGIIAKDADYLDCAFTAKEYRDEGYERADDWIVNTGQALRTDSAKRLWEALQTTHSSDWWKELKVLR
jgi:putative hydrolase of HD superfamily